MRDIEIQKEILEVKYKKKLELEKLKHENIMKEIEALKKSKVGTFVR